MITKKAPWDFVLQSFVLGYIPLGMCYTSPVFYGPLEEFLSIAENGIHDYVFICFMFLYFPVFSLLNCVIIM